MDIKALRYFLAVAREENMTRAAEALHVTQPTLSKQMNSPLWTISQGGDLYFGLAESYQIRLLAREIRNFKTRYPIVERKLYRKSPTFNYIYINYGTIFIEIPITQKISAYLKS